MQQRQPVLHATQEVLATQGLWLDSWADLDRIVRKGLFEGAIIEMRPDNQEGASHGKI